MNITIGQYYPVKSVIHSLNPEIKVISLFLYVVAIFFDDSFFVYLLSFLFLAVVVILSKVPIGLMIKGLRALWFVILFTSVFNICFAVGDNVLFSVGILNITVEGIVSAVKILIRLVLLIVASSVLTLTTPPLDLTSAVESIMKPLKRIKFPVHEIAMMMSIALRFIPTLMDEADKIKKAQTARGADFDGSNLAAKAKSLLPILVPLFVSAFRRADELACAMEARCYRGDINRTKMNVQKTEKKDIAAFAVVLVFFGAVCIIAFIL